MPTYSKKGKGGADAYNAEFGAVSFNYDQRLVLDTSFTGKDSGCERDCVLATSKGPNAFAGSGVNLQHLTLRPIPALSMTTPAIM